MSEPTIEPLSGFRDLLPTEAAARRYVIDTNLAIAHSYGYQQIDTPALEREEILSGQYGDEGDSLRYRFQDHGKRDVGLRYDLTVPFSRYISRFLPKQLIRTPFRRSHAAPVWRAEHAQAGRYREFIQCDFDIAGSSEPSADAEIIQIAAETLNSLGLPAKIRVSHRGVLDAILSSLDIPSSMHRAVVTQIDKWDKIGENAVREALHSIIGEKTNTLIACIKDGDSEALRNLIGEPTALLELREILSLATLNPELSGKIVLDLTIVRGLSYYTGMVFECFVVGAEQLGSVLSGGRYDGMVGRFMNRPLPAVGGSVGVDRVLAVLQYLKTAVPMESLADVALLPLSKIEVSAAVQLATTLRQAGISTVLYSGPDAQPGQLLGYASGVARFGLLIGSREVADGIFPLKNLIDRTQENLSIEEVITRLHHR